MNTVLIPAYRRPEFLWHCLQNIKLAEGADQLHYIFRLDNGHDPECLDVIKDWPYSHEVAATRRTPYRVGKQSYSLLTGYAIAAERSSGLVFMIEEDVMVARDFFRWHLAVQEAVPTAFCSIAVANPNRAMAIANDRTDAYYLGGSDYCSLGVCFRKEIILAHVLPLAQSRYFSDPIGFVARNFKGSPIGASFAEQDGLIRRAQMALGPSAPIVWPWIPRAYHAGYYGANRGAGPRGHLTGRIANLSAVIYSDEAMRIFAKHPEWYHDSRPINLNPPSWETQQLVPIIESECPVRF